MSYNHCIWRRLFHGLCKGRRRKDRISKEIHGTVKGAFQKEDIPTMAKHAAREANPLYPVPVLMNAKELETFYEKVATVS